MWVGTLRTEKRARQRWNGESGHRISVQAEDKMECRKWRGGGRGWAEVCSRRSGTGWKAESGTHMGALQGHNWGQSVQEAQRDRQGRNRGV